MVWRLSKKTSSIIDWSRATDGIRVVLSEYGADRGRAMTSASATSAFVADGEVVHRAFEQASAEFRRVLGPIKRAFRWSIGIVIGSIAVTIAGVAVSFLNPWGGGLLSLTGLGSLLGFLRRAWELARDQAMLELVPARYELVLSLATTAQQYSSVLEKFLKETGEMRRK